MSKIVKSKSWYLWLLLIGLAVSNSGGFAGEKRSGSHS